MVAAWGAFCGEAWGLSSCVAYLTSLREIPDTGDVMGWHMGQSSDARGTVMHHDVASCPM